MSTILKDSLVAFGREICGDLRSATRREWLVTNGIGGYASGTIAGVATRRYHGLLVAALNPPTGRTALVGGAVEWAIYRGARYPLSTHVYKDAAVDPHGYRHLQEFRLEGALPVWVFAMGDALLERRVWMEHGANTTYVHYELLRGTDTLELEITPLVTYRDFHSLNSGQGWRLGVESHPTGAVIHAFDGAMPFRLDGPGGHFTERGDWYWGFQHVDEASRGLDDRSDLFAPGVLSATLAPGEAWSMTASTDLGAEIEDVAGALCRERLRQARLLTTAAADQAPAAIQQLVLAADQFIVQRQVSEQTGASRSVIAGYPWFNDWGRDTMISVPGLTLATGRADEAADILRGFGQYVADGLLPNNFPDRPGVDAGYNTADAALWYLWATYQYVQATGDAALVGDILPVLQSIVNHYAAGTRYGIGADPVDGLLRAGEPGLQLTWMDAKIGDWVVTPRQGKAVELNALWYNALRIVAGFLAGADDAGAKRYALEAERVAMSFRARFWDPQRRIIADVIDGPDGDDWSVRPNQILTVSLPYPLLDGAEAEAVVRDVGRTLVTSYGLRSLAADDPGYCPTYDGDQWHRDSAYHQGTVWTWLLGAYVEAHYRVFGDAAAALAYIEPITHHLRDAGLGSVSEIFDADPPHLPRGCVAQAWSVAEVLRVWRMLRGPKAPASGRQD
ncbi:MAG: amylo-alpha-1,6-glucosidase [Chloroflexota bacterium]